MDRRMVAWPHLLLWAKRSRPVPGRTLSRYAGCARVLRVRRIVPSGIEDRSRARAPVRSCLNFSHGRAAMDRGTATTPHTKRSVAKGFTGWPLPAMVGPVFLELYPCYDKARTTLERKRTKRSSRRC